MSIPAPGVNFAEGRPGDSMTVAALNRVNPLSSLFEARDELWDVIRVDVTKAELPILVVLPHRVDMTLSTDEEAKVVAAGHPLDLDRVTKWHLDRIANFLACHRERPGKGITRLTAGQCQVAASCKAAHLQVLL